VLVVPLPKTAKTQLGGSVTENCPGPSRRWIWWPNRSVALLHYYSHAFTSIFE